MSAAGGEKRKPLEKWAFRGVPRILSPGFSQDFRHSSSTVWISRADVVNAKDYCGKVLHEANAKKFA